jgi:replicative DNA helicase Mcm
LGHTKKKRLKTNLYEFIQSHPEIMSQIDQARNKKDPTKLYHFYIDYNKLCSEFKEDIQSLGDFNIFSKQFTDDVKRIVSSIDNEFFDMIKDINIKVRFKNFLYDRTKNKFPNLTPIRSINSNLMGTYLCFRGVIRNVILSKAKMKKQEFECLDCGAVCDLDFNENSVFDGRHCVSCNSEMLSLIPIIGGTDDYQMLTIEELSNDSDSDISQVTVRIDGDLVNKFNLGESVIVTGNIRLDVYNDDVINQYKKKVADKKIYRYLSAYGGPTNGIDVDWFVEVNHMEIISDSNIMFNSITKDEIAEIKRLSTDHHLVDKLVASFAPDIYGHEVEKEALIYQLIGGNGKSLDPSLDKRGEIHIFLLGDPSTAKTDLLLWSLGIAHKSKFVYGGNMSKVGLTGGAEQTAGGKWVLTAGIASITDMGLLGIDEMNDVPDETLGALKEIMEKQTSTTTKIRSGSSNTRVSILGSANPPKGNRYNKHKGFFDNLGINISLFTRFDYVALFRDIPDPSKDGFIIEKIINSYEKINTAPISRELLAKYIYYMKTQAPIPKLSENAKNRIHTFFLKIRTIDLNENAKNPGAPENVTITARQIQSLLRFAYARARLLCKTEVDEFDVERAEVIITHMLNHIGIDPNTGKVDANILNGVKPTSEISRENVFFDQLQRMAESFGNAVPYDQFVDEIRKREGWNYEDINDFDLDKYINKLEKQHNIIILNGRISLSNFVRNTRQNK